MSTPEKYIFPMLHPKSLERLGGLLGPMAKTHPDSALKILFRVMSANPKAPLPEILKKAVRQLNNEFNKQ